MMRAMSLKNMIASKCFLMSFLLLILLAQCLYFAWDTGLTVDEPCYCASGYAMVRYNDYRFLTEHPPLTMQLGALPLLFLQPKYPIESPVYVQDSGMMNLTAQGSKFLYEMGNHPRVLLFLERIPIVLLTLLLGFVLFLWSFEIYGLGGALLTLFLFSLCPNIIAHGSLYTTDMGVTAFMFIMFYHARKFFKVMTVRNLILVGIFAGFALLSKISAMIIIPSLLALFIIFSFTKSFQMNAESLVDRLKLWIFGTGLVLFGLALSHKITTIVLGPLCVMVFGSKWFQNWPARPRWQRILSALFYGAGWILCLVMAIRIKKYGVLFRGASIVWVTLLLILHGAILSQPKRKYFDRMINLFSFVCFIAAIVVMIGFTNFFSVLLHGKPFSRYIEIFNSAFSHTMTYHMRCVANSFITCDWRYFGSVMIAKTSVVTLFLFLVGFPALILSKIKTMEKLVILLPPIAFFSVASFINHINIGLRHVLPVYPFLFLITGAVIPVFSGVRYRILKVFLLLMLCVPLGMMGIRNLSIFPHYLSYFNEWIGDSEAGARLTTDSNINWGQDNRRMADLVKRLGIPEIRIVSETKNATELQYEKINWRLMAPEELNHPTPGFYALDIHNYLAEQVKPDSWFYRRRPDYLAGRTIYVFKVE